jgi:hypothetical protein
MAKGNGLAVGLEAARRKAQIGTRGVYAPVPGSQAAPPPLPGNANYGMSQSAKNLKARQQAEAIPEGLTRPAKSNIFGQ